MSNPWQESGAMVYVALTVATFSAVTMCCVWVVKRHRTENTYTAVEEAMELTSVEKQVKEAEVILFEQHPVGHKSSAFTLDDSDDEENQPPALETATSV